MRVSIQSGIDNIEQLDSFLTGKRLGLLTGASGVNKDGKETIQVIAEKYGLCALFGAEHGVRGNLQAGDVVETYNDEELNIPVYSLYGKTKKPGKEMLEGIDVMIFDMQDATARFYTYMYSLGNVMESCAENNIPLVVLDRVAPLNGVDVEGTILDSSYSSFVGKYNLPSRIGLTIGEIALYINDTQNIGCDLRVVPLTGWRRELYLDETDVAWYYPSPNIPTVDANLAFIGTCVFEGVNISEGRGTTKPFEQIGAPWLNTDALIKKMAERNMPGVKLKKTYFTPWFSKYKDEMCAGVQLHITDRKVFKSFEFGLYLLEEIIHLHKDKVEFIRFTEDAFLDKLLGDGSFTSGKQTAEQLIASHKAGIEQFKEIKQKYHLYND